MAIALAFGTNWCSRSSRFAASSTWPKVTPVALPPGCARLLTRPPSTGSTFAPRKHDWNRRGRRLGFLPSAAPNNQDRNLTANQIRCQRGQSIVLALGPTKFDRDILAFDVAGLIQAGTKRGNIRCPRSGRLTREKPDDRDQRFLRVRSERPRDPCAAEQGDESA